MINNIMYYIIYKITNLLNNKVYVGMHQTNNINDTYMGSGKLLNLAYKKYGVSNFKKDILFVFDTFEEMVKKEAEIVTEEFCLRDDTYNLTNGGKGGWSYINRSGIIKFKGKEHSVQSKKLISDKAKGRPSPFTGQQHKNETKLIIGEKSRKFMTGKKRSDATKKKISDSMVERQTNEHYLKDKQNRMEYARSFKSFRLNESTKQKISSSVKQSWNNRPRPIRDWKNIQIDLDNCLDRKTIYEKYNISRNILDHGFAKGYISRPKKTN